MPRSQDSQVVAELAGSHISPVILVKIEFDDPVYVHSGVGTLTFNGNEYIGVGALGSISAPREQEQLGPAPVTMALSHIVPTYVSEALDSATYRSKATIYRGHRNEDGSLVGTPKIHWAGRLDSSSVSAGPNGAAQLVFQHVIDDIDEIDGRRYSDEDQQDEFTGDLFFEHQADIPGLKLVWGGGPTTTGSGRSGNRRFPGNRRERR